MELRSMSKAVIEGVALIKTSAIAELEGTEFEL